LNSAGTIHAMSLVHFSVEVSLLLEYDTASLSSSHQKFHDSREQYWLRLHNNETSVKLVRLQGRTSPLLGYMTKEGKRWWNLGTSVKNTADVLQIQSYTSHGISLPTSSNE